MSSRSCSTSCSVRGFIGCSVVCTHSDIGGWKWIPFFAGSQWLSAGALGGWPNARVNARLKPSTDPYPAAHAASVTLVPCRTCQAARSSITRRRIDTGAS